MKIFFSVGEPSGDLHGANLVRQLRRQRPDVQCVGYGGPLMQSAGCQLHEDLTELAVIMLARAVMNLHRFWDLISRADRFFQHQRPDAVVMIDYPGFNWWIARRAKAHGIPVFYYGVPQLWAWAGWRVRRMRRLVNHALCKLPFEETWFRQRGVNATYVGHPFFDQLREQQLDEQFIAAQRQKPGRLVTILPGSRSQEVAFNLESLLRCASNVHQAVPDTRFAVAAFKEAHAIRARQLAQEFDFPIDVHVGRTQELMKSAHSCMACSGSVSLELLYHTKPTVIVYRISRAVYGLGKLLVKVPYITLVNLLDADQAAWKRPWPYDPQGPYADQVLYPEYASYQDKSSEVASHVIDWLNDSAKHGQLVSRLAQLKQQIDHGGASRRASQYILDELAQQKRTIPRPHFQSPAPLPSPAVLRRAA